MILPLITFIVLATALACCITDFRTMRIPNALVLVIALSFVPAYAAQPAAFAPLWQHLAAAGGMFVLTYVMFAVGMIGAGDAKMGAALALWTGLSGLLAYVFYMALTGGVLGLVALGLRNWKPVENPQEGGWIALAQVGKNAVPYGIAIAAGAVAALLHTGFIHQRIDEVIKIIH